MIDFFDNWWAGMVTVVLFIILIVLGFISIFLPFWLAAQVHPVLFLVAIPLWGLWVGQLWLR